MLSGKRSLRAKGALLAALALPALAPPSSEIATVQTGLAHESAEVRREMLEKAVDFLSRYNAGEAIAVTELPSLIRRGHLQRVRGEEQDIRLADIANRFELEAYGVVGETVVEFLGKSRLDMQGPLSEGYWEDDIIVQGERLHEFERGLLPGLLEDALIHPRKPLDDLVRDALSGVKLCEVIDCTKYDWRDYDWSEAPRTGEDEEEGYPSWVGGLRRPGRETAYLLTHTEDALRRHRALAGLPRNSTRAIDVRARAVERIAGHVERARALSGLGEEARRKGVPLGQLAYALSSYSKSQNVPLTSQTQTEQRRKSQLSLTIEQMAIAALPQLRDLYESGIGTVIIADRGAHPFGQILKTIIEELDLPKIRIANFKFLRPDKIAEGYALADGNLPQELFSRQRALRSCERETRRADPKNARAMRNLLEWRAAEKAELYDAAYREALGLQLSSAGEALGPLDGCRVRVYDDLIKTGRTAQNIKAVLEGLGAEFSADDIVPLLDSRANAGRRALVRDALALSAAYQENTEWMDTLPWRALSEVCGIAYGIDKGAVQKEDLFRKCRDLGSFRIDPPAQTVYSPIEREAITKRFLESLLIDEDPEAENRVGLILSDCGTKDAHEGTVQRLNAYRSLLFRQRLRESVRNVLGQLETGHGCSARSYVLAADPSFVHRARQEQAIDSLAASLLEAH